MTGFVLDASLTATWLFEDEATPATEARLDTLATAGAITPPLWEYEVANLLVSATRRRRLTPAQASRCLELIARLPIAVAHEMFASPVSAQLVGVAARFDLTAYDAAYLWLAERSGLALGTVDRRLATAAQAAGVVVLPGAVATAP